MTRISFRCQRFLFLIFLAAAVCSLSLLSPAAAQGEVTLPAGTRLLVKMETSVVSSEAGKGDPFTGFLEKPVTVEGKTVFSRGTRVHGQVIVAVDEGKISGRPGMGLHLVEVEAENGTVSIKTLSQGFIGTTQGTVNNVVTGKVVGQAGPGIAVDASGRVVVKSGALIEFSLVGAVVVE